MGSIQEPQEREATAPTDWAILASAHRKRQHDLIPRSWVLDVDKLSTISGKGTSNEGRLMELQAGRNSGILTEQELEICGQMTANHLLDQIRDGKLTSEEVTVAFCKMAAVAQQTISCLTEIFFEEGIERAKWLDQQLKDTGKVVGPLHGLPISIKDSFYVTGKYSTVGYTEFLRRSPQSSNGALVNLLLDAGAVLYCKTNVPQTMMTADSENHIFGRTLCPHKTTLTAGGSSGGEGALVGFRGSPLGVGTDIAGSIRIPSLCCGTYGFKPTTNRVPFAGQAHYFNAIPHDKSIEPVAGPLANSVDDLALFMRTVTQQNPWKYDSTVNHVGWRTIEREKSSPLIIGVLAEDPTYRLHPPVRGAVERAVDILQRGGHNIVRLPFDTATSAGLGSRIGFQCFSLGGPDADQVAREAGEPLVTSVDKRVHPFKHGGFPVPLNTDKFTELCLLKEVKDEYERAWQKVWCENGLDALIAPGAISTSVPHDTYGCPVYTLMWNVLDYPAGIIPFGTASKAEFPEAQPGTAEFDADYDPEACDGAPCAIQVVAPRFHDEECLAAMAVIDREFKRYTEEARPHI